MDGDTPYISAYTQSEVPDVHESIAPSYLSACDQLPEIARGYFLHQIIQSEPVSSSSMSQSPFTFPLSESIPASQAQPSVADTLLAPSQPAPTPVFAFAMSDGSQFVYSTLRNASSFAYIQAKKKYKPAAEKVNAVRGSHTLGQEEHPNPSGALQRSA